MFTKKTTKLTKIEASALSIAQWCIIELLPKEFKDKPIFFTQVTVLTIPTSKLENGFGALNAHVYRDTEFKAIDLKAYFTILDGSIDDFTPYVYGEILFARVFDIWLPYGFIVNATTLLIEEYPVVEYDITDLYDERFPYDSENLEHYNAAIEREKRLEEFINKFFSNTIFDKKS